MLEARDGNRVALRELHRVFLPPARRVARGFADLDEAEVDDVVQEGFVRCFRALGQLKQPSLFSAWLLAAVRHRALSAVAKKATARKVRDELEQTQVGFEASVVTEGQRLERDAAIVSAVISELPEGPEKETVRLFYVEGELSAREIAERLGVGKSAVTMRLERFRARIKGELLRRVLKARVE